MTTLSIAKQYQYGQALIGAFKVTVLIQQLTQSSQGMHIYKYVSDEYCCKLLCVKVHMHICIAAMYNELYRTTMLSDTYLKLQYVVMPTQLIKR